MYRKEKRPNKKIVDQSKGPVNKTLLYIFGGLILFGIIMVFDASVYKANEQFFDSFYFLKHHLVWLVIGGVAGFIMYKFDLKLLLKLAVPAMIATVILLILVLIFGDSINGAKRWFEIAGIPFQPAEFAKLTIVIYLAAILSKSPDKSSSQKDLLLMEFKRKAIVFASIVSIVLILVMLEPDMGTTIIIGLTSFIVFFLSGDDRIHLIGSSILAGVMGIVGVMSAVFASYRLQRITTFLHLLFKGEVDNPTGEGYQIQQILIGIGSSGFWGKGFGQSRQRFGYLVENTAFTDSIFAIVLEELGYASAILMVIVWIVILIIGFRIAMKLEDRFSKLLVAGIVVWLTSQALLNMAANVALIPLTGIPLPFLTYGGSNTIVTLAAIGLLLNISRYAKSTK